MTSAWQDYVKAMERANAWEAQRLRERVPDYAEALRWLSEAWELAEKYGGDGDPEGRREERRGYLLQLMRALEQARLTP